MEPARFSIEKDGSLYIVRGEDVERMVAMTNFDNEEAVDRLQNAIRKMGIEDAMAKKGLKNGDTVSIRGVEFEYYLPGQEEDEEV